MSTLSDIIAESIAAVEVPGRAIRTHEAAEYGFRKILADTELTAMAVREWLTVKIQTAIKKSTKRSGLQSPLEYVQAWRGMGSGSEITMLVPRQGDLFIDPFKLNDGYALEGAPEKSSGPATPRCRISR